MAFDFNTLVTDRSSEDVVRVRTITSKLVAGTATDEERLEFNSFVMKGAYNYTDLNRVNNAMDELNSMLTNAGYSTNYVPLNHIWTEQDIPTVSQMQTMRTNLVSLRSALNTLDALPATPDSFDNLTVLIANNIEQILFGIYVVLTWIASSIARSGAFTFISGCQPLPVEDEATGRTWQELDSMNTTWQTWDSTSWFMLLFGNLTEEGVIE